jgi:uncharacterized membrane protein HdeD (DUF308 family)
LWALGHTLHQNELGDEETDVTGRMQLTVPERIQRDWVTVTGTVLIVVGLIIVFLNSGTAFSVGFLTLGATLTLVGAALRIEAAIRGKQA